MTGECVKLSLEQEQNLVKQVLDIITPLLPQHVRANIKPVIRQLVMEEDSVFDTTARSPRKPATILRKNCQPAGRFQEEK